MQNVQVKEVNFYDTEPENCINITNPKEVNLEELINHILKSPLGYLNSVLGNCQKIEFKFAILCYAVEYGCSYQQYIDFIKFSFEVLKIGTKIQNDLKSIIKIINDEDLTKFKNELINFVKNYPKNKSQDDLNYEKLINCLSTLRILKDKQTPMSNFDKFNCICLYVKHIINQNITEEINFVCSLIEEVKNVANEIFVNFLYKKANQFLNSNSIQNDYSLSTYLVPPARIYPFTSNYKPCENTLNLNILIWASFIKSMKSLELSDFIDNFLFKKDMCNIDYIFICSHFRLEANKFIMVNYLFIAAKFDISLLKFQALIGSFVYKIEKILGELNQISRENQYKNAEQLLSPEDCERIKKELIDLAENFPVENSSQYDICCWEIASFYINKLKSSKLDIELQEDSIKNYFEAIIRSKVMDEINLVCQVINKSQAEITMDIVNSLFELASTFMFFCKYLLNSKFISLKNIKENENENKFFNLRIATNYGFSLEKFYKAIEFFLNTIKEILPEPIDQNKTIAILLNDNEIDEETQKDIQKKLIYFLRNYSEKVKSENEINCERIAKLDFELRSFAQKNTDPFKLFEKYNKIIKFLIKIINLNDVEKIDFVLYFIDTSSKNTAETYEILLEAIEDYENTKQSQVQQTLPPAIEPVPQQESPHEHQEEK